MAKWRKQFSKFRRHLPEEVRADDDLSLSAFLQSERKRILRAHTPNKFGGKRSLAKRISLRKRAKILRAVYGRGKRKTIQDPHLLLYKSKPDLLRDTLCPTYTRRFVGLLDRARRQEASTVDLKDFSFARNPKGTLSQIRLVARLAASSAEIRLNFCDDKCDDVAPYIVLAHLIQSLPPIFSGGIINREVTAVVRSVGLDRPLGIGRILGPNRQKNNILPFKMIRRAPPGFFGDKDHQLRPQYKEIVADRFFKALENWLRASGYELTPEGIQLIINSITEALDNAERHGHPKVDEGMGDWWMAGFSRLENDEEGRLRLDCSVAIVSIGSTISESLQTAGKSVADRIDSYVGTHISSKKCSEELLRTVTALQDGVTRVKQASDVGRGGVGLLTLVDFFATLGETDKPDHSSIFTILSGESCLRMSDEYRRGIPETPGGLRELWLNPANDVSSLPDPNHAFSLEDRFPGTILAGCFSIDREFLMKALAA